MLAFFGFRSGRAFEPGCGAGAFMSAASAGMDIAWTGIDIDPTSTRIAKLLHPDAEIVTGSLRLRRFMLLLWNGTSGLRDSPLR